MKFKLERKTLIRIAIYALFLVLAPFAFELVIMADIIGVEAAMAFLFVYGRSVSVLLQERVVLGYNLIQATYKAMPHTPYYGHKMYTVGTVSSFLLFLVTGSLLVSAVAWVPSLMFIGQQI